MASQLLYIVETVVFYLCACETEALKMKYDMNSALFMIIQSIQMLHFS